MVSLLASIEVDRGSEPRSSQTEVGKIYICCFSEKCTRINKEQEQTLVGSESE